MRFCVGFVIVHLNSFSVLATHVLSGSLKNPHAPRRDHRHTANVLATTCHHTSTIHPVLPFRESTLDTGSDGTSRFSPHSSQVMSDFWSRNSYKLRHDLLLYLTTPPVCPHHHVTLDGDGEPTVATAPLISDTGRSRSRATSITHADTTTAGLLGLTVVCISDTHGTTPDLPMGDILVHAGDLTAEGRWQQVQSQIDWLSKQPHRYKVVIGGNHDFALDDAYLASERRRRRIRDGRVDDDDDDDDQSKVVGKTSQDFDWGGVLYLCNEKIDLVFPPSTGVADDGQTPTTSRAAPRVVTIYGSPLSPSFGRWAFQYPPVQNPWANALDAVAKPNPNSSLQSLPSATPNIQSPASSVDVFVVHGPPRGYLDYETPQYKARERALRADKQMPTLFQPGDMGRVTGCGCRFLLHEIRRARPRVVVCGHIHEGRGVGTVGYNPVAEAVDRLMVDAAATRDRRPGWRVRATAPGWTWLFYAALTLVWANVCAWWRYGTSRETRTSCGCTLVVNAAAVNRWGKGLVDPAITVVI